MSRFFLIVATAPLVAGCAAVKPHADFPAVRDDVAARVGADIHWHDGSPADAEANTRVAALLARPLDANAAVQIALLNNRRLQAVYENLGVAQADLVQAGLLRNPVFDAAYKFGDAGAKAKIDLGLSFDFVDLLFIGTRKSIAAAELEAVKARVTAAVLDVTADVRRAFYDCQAARQTVELRRQIVQATTASADLARRLREAGNTTALALASEQALNAEAQLALDRAEAAEVAARERLTALLGAWGAQTQWTITDRLPEPAADDTPADGVEAMAVARSLDLRAGRAAVTSAAKALGIALPLGYLSALEAGVTAEREGETWYTGPSVALPLPLFSQGQPALARAASRVRQAEATLSATAVDVRSAARAADARVKALRKQADFLRNSLLPLRQQVVTQTQLHYNAMQVGAFELLTAKRDQIEAAATYLNVLRDYWSAKADLDSILAGKMPRTAGGPNSTEERLPRMNTDEHG